MPRWTEEQTAAIRARGENLLLAAAAGSGKTTVMVERILSLIAEGVSVDEMLIVTFTRASAADMRAKLTDRLSALADGGDAHCRERLARLESASISTIHAFCTALLRTHFEAAGVDPAFRILDDAENAVCEDAAVDEALEAAYARMDENLARLDFGRGPKKVRELAVELYHGVADRPDPEAWMAQAERMARGDGKVWLAELTRAARQQLRQAIAYSESGIRLALQSDGTPAYADALNADIEALEALLTLDYDDLRKALAAFKQVTPKTPRKPKGVEWPEAVLALREQVKGVRDAAKKCVESAAKLLRYEREQAVSDMREDADCMAALFDLVRDIARRHGARKAEKSALTFSDLEHMALELLRQDEVASAVRARYRYVFVDEYQDTSDVQEELVSRIARTDNRFMVGDVKQSIYRFRQAEPALFLNCYRRYGAGDGGRLIALTRNFRSRPAILELTNRVFERAMNGGDAEIEYDALSRLNPGAQFEGQDPPVELILLAKRGLDGGADPAEEPEDADELAELTHVEREAAVVAGRIRRLMAEQPELHYRDIAVLTRAGRTVIPAMLTALLDAGIPAYAEGSAGYFDAMEVQVFLAYLTLVENHRRDEALIAVLRSPMQRISSPELALIRAEAREGAFCDAVAAYAEHDNDLGRRLATFLRDLENDRVLSRSMPLPRLFSEIWRRTGFADALLALPGGKQRKANLDRLSARAAQYEANQSGGLTGFLRYAERMRARGDDEVAHTVGEAYEVVRLMTVHKSKGLEFPVVFGVGLGKRFRVERSGDGLLAHRELGLGMAHVDPALSTRRETIAHLAIARRRQAEDRAEELRILYVLLTRAKERLILIGGVDSAPRKMNLWRIAVDEPSVYGCALDVILPALLAAPGGEAAISPEGPEFSGVTEAPVDGMEFDGKAARAAEVTADGMESVAGKERVAEAVPGALENQAGATVPDEAPYAVHTGCVRLGDADVWVRWLEEEKIQPVEPAEQARRSSVARSLLEAADGVYRPQVRDEALLEAMSWRYPREMDVKKPIKLTASGLLRELEGPDVVPELAPRPLFMTEEGMTGAEKGSAVHAAMQNLDYGRLREAAPVRLSLLGGAVPEDGRAALTSMRRELTRQLDEMRARGILTEKQREVVPEAMLARFFAGETGRRILAAEVLHREWPFNLRMEAEDALAESERGDYAGTMILVQGTIDLCFIEDGQWVLVDYKTDRSTDIEELKAHYRNQLALYATALERITGIPVKQRLLCLLRRGMVLEL